MPIKLPIPGEKIKPKEINPKFLLMYGSPKVGKTSAIATLNDTYLLIEIDPHGAAYFEGTYVEVNNLQELNEVIQEVKKLGKPYKYIIIDTITKLSEWMEDYATGMYKRTNLGKNFQGDNVVGELPKGAGYFWLRRAFNIWFEDLKQLGDRIIFIGHVKDAALTTKTSDSMGNDVIVEKLGVDDVTTTDLDLTGKLKQIVCSQMDAIGYLYRKTVGTEKGKPVTQLRINFNAGSSVLGGARPAHLRGVDMELDWNKIYIQEGQEKSNESV